MKLIDVTNGFPDLVRNQLDNTDALYIRVYSLGNTTVIYSEAEKHNEIVLFNRHRNILQHEIDYALDYFALNEEEKATCKTIETHGVAEISIKKAHPAYEKRA